MLSERLRRPIAARRRVLRIAIPARLAGVFGILEAAALGERAPGIALLRRGPGRAVFRRARAFVAIVSLPPVVVSAIVVVFVPVVRPIIVIEQQVAHQRVLPVEHPETVAAAVVPIP